MTVTTFDAGARTGRLPAQARTFAAMMRSHPGPWFTLPVAAVAAAMEPEPTNRHLAALVLAGVVERDGECWRLAAHGALPERPDLGALERIAAWYLHAADNSLQAMGMVTRYSPLGVPEPDHLPAAPEGFAQGYAWLVAHRENLQAAMSAAAAHGLHQPAWQLALILTSVYDLDGDVQGWIEAAQVGRAAAARAGDRAGEAMLLDAHGQACTRQGWTVSAEEFQQQAATLRRQCGDQLGQCRSVDALGQIAQRRGDLSGARDCFNAAATLAEYLGDERMALIARYHLAAVLVAREGFGAAEPLLRDVRKLLVDHAMAVHAAGAARHLSVVLIRQGRLQEAAVLAQDAAAETAQLGICLPDPRCSSAPARGGGSHLPPLRSATTGAARSLTRAPELMPSAS